MAPVTSVIWDQWPMGGRDVLSDWMMVSSRRIPHVVARPGENFPLWNYRDGDSRQSNCHDEDSPLESARLEIPNAGFPTLSFHAKERILAFMWNARYFHPVSRKSEMCWQILVKLPSIKFNGNPFKPYVGLQTFERTSWISWALCRVANAPRKTRSGSEYAEIQAEPALGLHVIKSS
jgi:hypothetical protein